MGDTLSLTVNGKPVTVRIVGEIFTPGGGDTLFASWQTLGGAAARLAVGRWAAGSRTSTALRAE